MTEVDGEDEGVDPHLVDNVRCSIIATVDDDQGREGEAAGFGRHCRQDVADVLFLFVGSNEGNRASEVDAGVPLGEVLACQFHDMSLHEVHAPLIKVLLLGHWFL